MTPEGQVQRREADPTLVHDDRPWYLKAELWYFLLPLLLVSALIVGIRYAAGAGTAFDIAWIVLVVVAVLLFPFWSWFIEPTPVDHTPAETRASEDRETKSGE